MTSHQGFLTSDAIKEIAETTISNLNAWQDELPCHNELSVKVDPKSKSEQIDLSL